MAAMGGGHHGAGATRDPEAHKIKSFHTAMQKSQNYPYNFDPRHIMEQIKLVGEFRRHFDQTKADILLALGENVTGVRKRLIERKIRVRFYDAGLRDAGSSLGSMSPQGQPPTTAGSLSTPRMQREETGISRNSNSSASIWDSEDTKVYSVSNSEHLEATFGINSPYPPADPVCRFIFLPTSAPIARRLKVTEELLLKILTYHQVSPCFLNFISYFGHEPLSGAGDHLFGGFRSLKSFSEPFSNLEALDRSGYHYQLAFEFRTVFRPGDDHPGDGAATEPTAQTSDNPDLWPLDQCAIYHHFDVENGKSLWVITAAEGEGSKPPPEKGRPAEGVDTPSEPEAGHAPPLFGDVENARFSTDVLSTSPIIERFRASLSVLLWLADWSLSEYSHYIIMLDDDLQKLTRPYIEAMVDGGPVGEIGLKKLNRYMEKLDEIIVALQGNLRVCKAARKFYHDELLQDRKLKTRNLAWMTDKESRTRIREELDDFEDKMRLVCTSTQGMLRRAVVLKQVGVRRENTVHRLLQNRDVTTTNKLAVVTQRDSATMRVFSTITLILLPVSVVSTFFSANIVDFQTGSGGFAGSWSGPGALWWAVTTLLVTALVAWAGERWRRPAIDPTTILKERPRKSWTIQVHRIINDFRVRVHPYEHSILAAYTRVVGFLKPVPAAHTGTGLPLEVLPREQSPSPPLSSPISTACHGPLTLGLDVGVEESIVESSESGPAHKPAPSDRGLPQQLPAPPRGAFGAMVSPGREKLRSKGFDQASAAEQGLVRVTTPKEKVINRTEKREK